MDFREDSYGERLKDNLCLTPRRMVILPWLGWAVVVGLAIAGTFYVSRLEAAEARVQNQEECMLYADYAITTRAMVVSGVDLQKRLETLEQMYVLKDDRMRELAKIVRQAADKSALMAGDFAGTVLKTCVGSQGDISGLLGPSS